MAVVYDRAEDEGWPEHFVTEHGCEPECEDVLFVFGVKATDTGSIWAATWPEDDDHLKVDRGSLVFDPAFSLESTAAQVWLLNFTANARRLPMFAPRAAENAVVLPDPQHPALPTCVLEAALSPGPMWQLPQGCQGCQMALLCPRCISKVLSDPEHAVGLGGGCELGPGFAACFDAYVTAAASGPSASQRSDMDGLASLARAAGVTVPSIPSDLSISVPTLWYEADKLKALGIALHSTLDGREQGRWDYATRHASWQLLEAFVQAQIAGTAFSFCSAKDPKRASACYEQALTGDSGACAAAAGGGVCQFTTLPAIGAAPPGLDSGWFHAANYITTDMQESLVNAALESGGIAVLLAFGCLFSATRSVRMSAVALTAIVSTLILVVGWLVFLGWNLGPLESMCMAISVGICVDFICHQTHAYTHAAENAASRADRVAHALAEMVRNPCNPAAL